MKTLLIIFAFLLSLSVSAQDATEEAEDSVEQIEMTDIQISKINAISKSIENLKKQYEQASKELENQMSEVLIFILDANGLDPREYGVQGVEGRQLAIKKLPEK